jgi:hypothetical protein
VLACWLAGLLACWPAGLLAHVWKFCVQRLLFGNTGKAITNELEAGLWGIFWQVIVVYGVAELVTRLLFVDSDAAKHKGHSVTKNQPLFHLVDFMHVNACMKSSNSVGVFYLVYG